MTDQSAGAHFPAPWGTDWSLSDKDKKRLRRLAALIAGILLLLWLLLQVAQYFVAMGAAPQSIRIDGDRKKAALVAVGHKPSVSIVKRKSAKLRALPQGANRFARTFVGNDAGETGFDTSSNDSAAGTGTPDQPVTAFATGPDTNNIPWIFHGGTTGFGGGFGLPGGSAGSGPSGGDPSGDNPPGNKPDGADDKGGPGTDPDGPGTTDFTGPDKPIDTGAGRQPDGQPDGQPGGQPDGQPGGPPDGQPGGPPDGPPDGQPGFSPDDHTIPDPGPNISTAVVEVPEPGSLALFAAGILMLLMRGRRFGNYLRAHRRVLVVVVAGPLALLANSASAETATVYGTTASIFSPHRGAFLPANTDLACFSMNESNCWDGRIWHHLYPAGPRRYTVAAGDRVACSVIVAPKNDCWTGSVWYRLPKGQVFGVIGGFFSDVPGAFITAPLHAPPVAYISGPLGEFASKR